MNNIPLKAKNLIDLNWNNITLDQRNFSFKLLIGKENSFELLLFNLDDFKLFYLKQDEDEINKLFKSLNPSLEAPIHKILDHLKSNFFENNDKNEFFIDDSPKSNVLLIKMNSKLSGIKFVWEFRLEMLDSIYLKFHLVLPLILNCAEYQLREFELVKTIQAKDKEIDDYKCQGACLSRKYLETDVFEIKKFEESIKNRSQIVDLVNNPEKCLANSLHQKVHESCCIKYFKNNVGNTKVDQKKESDSDNFSIQTTSSISSSNFKPNNDQKNDTTSSQSSQKLSKKEELDRILNEDTVGTASQKTINKKKKLF
ncbi:unnamed protein product [Brachionus calyciflorus]|uniref:Non-homologous end-joining factor 1 n=1 Tax=Brachionus calyciflorus TaxID=104777 RepID=A0A813PMC6_9BILA|nr:unnamed protein product [Brachionus calyciflorus]